MCECLSTEEQKRDQGNGVKKPATNASSAESVVNHCFDRWRRAVDIDATGFEAIGETTVFLSYFKNMPDHWQAGNVTYPLKEILLLRRLGRGFLASLVVA